MLHAEKQDKTTLLDPLWRAGRGFYVLTGILSLLVLWGVIVYIRQVILGMGVTAMNRPVYWGLYMVSFIFFIGISHAGTLISAILRVTQAEWRRPITRIAESITVIALIVGTLQILFDLGRPDRILYLVWHGRLQSPLLWDAASVTAYFLGSVTYLYLPLIPDLALLRDNAPEDGAAWRRRFYATFSLGWRGNRTQWLRLEKTIAVLAVMIIPVAVSVHTIISWILATNTQPGWHSTVFGPYFVVGAIYSGIAALFIAMSVVRRTMHLEEYITDRQYRNLGFIFIAISAIWFYFTFAEYLTLAAGQQKAEFPVLASKLWGEYQGSFWGMVLLMVIAFWVMVAPQLAPRRISGWFLFNRAIALVTLALALAALLAVATPVIREALLATMSGLRLGLITVSLLLLAGFCNLMQMKRHLVSSMVIASICVLAGMWLERWNIVAPTMSFPRLMPSTSYVPSFTEWSLLAASVALFVLLFTLFFKLFPPISVWEVAEGRVIEEAESRVEIPMPEVNIEGALS